MATQQDYVLKFSADTGNVDSAIQDVQGGVEKTDTAVGGLTKQLDKMSGGAITGFRNFTAGIKNGVTGLKSFKVALAATGIGLLVVAIASLVSYFQSTKEGAEKLRVIMSTLGAVVDVIRDRVSKMGKILFEAISNPQETIKNLGKLIKENLMNRFEGMLELIPAVGKAISLALKGKFSEAGKVATDAAGKVFLGVESVTDAVGKAGEAIADLTDEIKKEAQAAADLQRALNKLKDEERDFIRQRAETNKQIAEARLLAEDDTLAVEERIEALQRAVNLEQQTVARQIELAEERARIAREQVALGESLEEDLQAVAEAEAVVIDLQTASLRTQKRLQTELNSLKVEGITKAHEAMKAEIDLMKATAEANTKRREEDTKTLQVVTENQDKTLQVSTTSLAQQVLGTETAEETKRRLSRETLEDFLNGAELIGLQSLEVAQGTIDTLTALNESFGAASVERQAQIDGLLEQAAEAADENEKARLLDKANELAKIQDREGEKQFERGKKIQIAQTIISTYEGATQAYKSLAGIPVVGPGLGIAAAAAALAAGFNNVKSIKATKFEGQATSEKNSYSGISAGAAQPAPTTPQLDLGFLGGGAGQTGIRTYVVSSEVTNSQQANQRINDQASLVG